MIPSMRYFFLLTILMIALSVRITDAHAFDLTFPLDCNYGENCIISSYVDTNPEPEEAPEDYRCGALTYEGSHTTRFMLKDFLEMRKGVSVLAAEDGVVLNVRDGMNDISTDLSGMSAVRGKECGNGIVVEHRRGFITEYCHLLKGSIQVQVGDKVQKGGRMALVGVSGKAAYPQLELTVKRNDEFYDPFLGDEPLRCGSLKAYPLWDREARKKLTYIPTMLLNAHFYNKVPYAMGARDGGFRAKAISPLDDKLIFWADIFGIQQGDKLTLQLVDPAGVILDEEIRVFDDAKERHFQFVGKMRKTPRWQEGEYHGIVQLIRQIGNKEKYILDEEVPISVAVVPDQ